MTDHSTHYLFTVFLVMLFVITIDSDQQMNFDDILTLIQIWPKSERDNRLLEQNRMEFMIDFWSALTPSLKPLKATVHKALTSKFTNFLSKNGIKFEVIRDLSKRKPKYFADIPKPFDYEKNYNDLNTIYKELKRLSAEYSDRLSMFSLGKTSENRDIMAVNMKSNSGLKRTVVFECGIHAREWISTSFCLWSINKLINDRSLLDDYQFLIIPTINPDGYHYTWTKDRYWRKNRKYNNKTSTYENDFGSFVEVECYGIDLNRNFQTKRFCLMSSSSDACDLLEYCGPKPMDASETKALNKHLTSVKDSLFVYFSIHSYSQLWLYSYGYTKQPVKNRQELHKLSKMAVSAIEKVRGTKYTYGPIATTIYPASGSSIDWVYDTFGLNYTFVLELPDTGDYGFELPESEIKPVSEETWTGIETVLKQLAIPESAMRTAEASHQKDNQSTTLTVYKTHLVSVLLLIHLITCL